MVFFFLPHCQSFSRIFSGSFDIQSLYDVIDQNKNHSEINNFFIYFIPTPEKTENRQKENPVQVLFFGGTFVVY